MLIKILFTLLFVIPIIWGHYNFLKYNRIKTPLDKRILVLTLNSACLYALAFNLVFMIQEFFLVLGKKSIGLEATLYHNDHHWEGDHPLMFLMQGTGFLAILVFGIICSIFLWHNRNSKSHWKILLLWLGFNALIQSLPQIPISYMEPQTDLGEALIGYLNLDKSIMIPISVLAILAIPFVAIWYNKRILELAPDYIDVKNPKSRLIYVRFVVVLGGIIGTILVFPFRILPIEQIRPPILVFLISIPWMWASAPISRNLKPKHNNANERIFYGSALLLIVLLLFFHLVLASGLKF